jgi:competence protein ComEC
MAPAALSTPTVKRPTPRRLAPALLLIGSLLAAWPAAAAELVLRFLDVGQGDAVLLSHEGKHVLVDTGPSDTIVAQLRGHDVQALELLVVSHNHADHMGGADAILGAMPVGRYADNELPAKTKLQEVVRDLLAQRQTEYRAPKGALTLGDATLHFLTPPGAVGGDAQNNASVGLILEHGAFKALLTGDSEVEEIGAWLAAAAIPDVDVLKAPHHGSRNGVTPLWLHTAKPEVVVISCGAGNGYGHPHEMALRYYATGERRILRTDVHGEVVIRVQTDGAYAVEPARLTPPATPAVAARTCCLVCRTSTPCGDACITKGKVCKKPPGCACASPP